MLMFRTVRLVACLLLAAAIAACEAPRSTEQQVFDLVASEVIAANGDTVAFAPNADTRWFDSTSADAFIADGKQGEGNRPGWLDAEYVPLVRRFFTANRTASVLPWKPIDHRGHLLDGTFASKPRGTTETNAMCFEDDAGQPVDVAVRTNGRFVHHRPYWAFSRVAFSDDGQLAMLKIAKACAPMNGAHESVLVLRRVDGSWRLVDGTKLWVS